MRRTRLKTECKAGLLPRRQFLLKSGYLMSAAVIGTSSSACKPQPAASATEKVAKPRALKLAPQELEPVDTPVAKIEPSSQDLTRISLVDTIIPTDDSVGAIDIGLDAKLQEEMASKPKAKEWIDRMVHSVSQISLAQHRKEFRDLDIDQREKFINELLANRVNTITWNDVRRLRRVLLTWYYQSDVGAATIGFYLPSSYPSYPGERPTSTAALGATEGTPAGKTLGKT